MEDELRQMAESVGLDKTIIEYLQSRRAISVGLLGAMASNFAEVDQDPLVAGYDHEGKHHQVETTEVPVVKAGLRYLWKLCNDKVHGTTPAQSSQQTATPATTSAPQPKQVPKEIPPSELAKLIDHYENQKVDGRCRVFNQRMLLGAERVVARVWHEIQTRSHTPLLLHEILCLRHYDAAGNTNMLAQVDPKASGKVILDMQDHSLHLSEENTWTPKGLLSVLDALDAVAHCWILVQIAHELAVLSYIDWWRAMFRGRTGKLEQLKSYWVEANWKLSLALRRGRDFQAVTEEIMGDQSSLQSALHRDPPALPKPKPQPPARANQTKPNTPYRGNQNQQDHRQPNRPEAMESGQRPLVIPTIPKTRELPELQGWPDLLQPQTWRSGSAGWLGTARGFLGKAPAYPGSTRPAKAQKN